MSTIMHFIAVVVSCDNWQVELNKLPHCTQDSSCVIEHEQPTWHVGLKYSQI